MAMSRQKRKGQTGRSRHARLHLNPTHALATHNACERARKHLESLEKSLERRYRASCSLLIEYASADAASSGLFTSKVQCKIISLK